MALFLMTLKAKSAQAAAKRARETTWKIKPANMMFFPRSLDFLVSAEDAMPPPRAWRTRLMMSQVQKTIVYVRGLKKEISSP